ncbi:hypothetical protein WJX81_001083 [Elliptochloris bilobata]|uniref:Phosphoglycerate mutase n=1 Tax=Elliptochloris bilobata TaxID=381761 RepID=A0AAW1S5P2_9CHLO
MQTALVIVRALSLPASVIEVDWSVCEVLSERFLAGSGRPAPQGSAAEWIPETLEDAHARYAAALEAIADRHAGCSCILVVTHGECVRRAVTRLEPRALVYEVRHCGWVAARREREPHGGWGLWQLGQAPDGACCISWAV